LAVWERPVHFSSAFCLWESLFSALYTVDSPLMVLLVDMFMAA
jgi:hypothetical protein